MRKRIYWLLPDLASARRTMHDLLAAHVAAAHIHFAAREGTDMSGLHAANVWQTSDLVHAAETGLVVGTGVGIVAGLPLALLFPVVGEAPQWAELALMAALGGLIGAWSSTMIGVSIPSPRLRRFEASIAQGRILLMVDVRPDRAPTVEALLRLAHPEAHFEGRERLVPALL